MKGKVRVVFIDEEDLPSKRAFGKEYRSWIPWAAIEQIPEGMALDLAPWLGGRKAKTAGTTFGNPNSRLARKFPHLKVIVRSPTLFIWNPSRAALRLVEDE